MDSNAYRSELDRVRYTAEGRTALTDRLMEAAKEPEEKRRRSRWTRGAAVAALAAVLLAGSAVAAAGIPGNLMDWFMRQWEDQTDRDMGENQTALIEQLTQEIGTSVSESGVTVTLDSVTRGNSGAWLLLRVSGADIQQTDLPYYFGRMDLSFMPNPDTVETPGSYGMSVEFSRKSEDGLLMLISYDSQLIEEDSLLKGYEGELLLRNLMCGDSVTREGEWRLSFSLPPVEGQPLLTLDSVTVSATDQKTQKRCMTELRNIQISATDIRFTQSAEDQMCAPQLDALVLKDGTEIKTTGGASRWTSGAGGGEWATIHFWTLPVDLEQAVGFRVGEQTIFLDAIE